MTRFTTIKAKNKSTNTATTSIMLWPRSFALDRVLLFVDAEDGAFDEGDVEVAAGGVEVDAVDFADSDGQAPQDFAGLRIDGGDDAAAAAGVDYAVLFDNDAGGVLIAETHVDGPQFFEGVAVGGDCNKLAVHGLGVCALAVLADAEGLAVAVALVAPNLTPGAAVDGSHVSVGGDNDDLVVGDYGNNIARAEHIGRLAVVPYPFQMAILERDAAQVGVPGTKDDIVTVDDGSGLAVVEE